jgi:hypothetical protein
MAKLPWYMKYDKKTNSIEFHWLWIMWTHFQIRIWLLVQKLKSLTAGCL